MLHLKKKSNHIYKLLTILFCLIACLPGNVFALGAEGPPKESSVNNPLAIILLSIMALLLFIILVLARVVRISMKTYRNRFLNKTATAICVVIATFSLLVLSSGTALAQGGAADSAVAETAKAATNIAGLNPLAFYLMIAVIIAEAIVIIALLYNLKVLLTLENKSATQVVAGVEGGSVTVAVPKQLNWWERFNSFRPIEEEKELELDHEYDGIRELDNRLPPWWLYGFYFTILFAGVYLWYYHVSHRGPSSAQEFEMAMKKGEEQKAEYLKKAGNLIDENTVKLLTDAKDLDAGKTIFTTVCKACHGEHGEGTVIAPNLTDDYWLHGGKVNDVFKTIKYGVAGKGMQSWQESYSPLQIAQLASYIKSIHGTKPANAKAPEGELYKEDSTAAPAATTDTTAAK